MECGTKTVLKCKQFKSQTNVRKISKAAYKSYFLKIFKILLTAGNLSAQICFLLHSLSKPIKQFSIYFVGHSQPEIHFGLVVLKLSDKFGHNVFKCFYLKCED